MNRIPTIRFLLIAALLIYASLSAKAQSTRAWIDSLIQVIPHMKEDTNKAYYLSAIAQWKMGDAQNNGHWEAAEEWANRALAMSGKLHYLKGLFRSNWALGIIHMETSSYPEALKYHTNALEISIRLGGGSRTVFTYGYIGDCYFILGDYREALKNYSAGLELLNKMNEPDQPQHEHMAMKIGKTYMEMKDYAEAIRMFDKMLEKKLKYALEGDVRKELAKAQIKVMQYDKARENLRIAIESYPAQLNQKVLANYKGVKGDVLLQIGDIWFTMAGISPATEKINAYRQAVFYLEQSVPLLLDGSGGKESKLKAYNLLREACEGISDYERSLHYTKLYDHLKDSIYSKQTYLKMVDLKVQYETEKAALEMKAQRETEILKEKALRERMISDQRVEQEKLFAAERIEHQKQIADQRLKQEAAIQTEKLLRERAIGEEKRREEKLKADKERTNSLLLMTIAVMAITSIFFILFLRQRTKRKRAVEKAEAIHKMAELELQSLRSQLNPHFMFNSLNSIQELILMQENGKSHSYLARFSKLLRMLLENAEKPFVPLQKELDFLQLYMALENLRVPDLQYSIDIDPQVNTEETLIPNMILQPYIENAIWHGLSHKAHDKQLQVRIFRENGSINYEIEDNGVGRKRAEELKSLFRKMHNSRGMELLSKRFKLLHKEYGSHIITTTIDVTKEGEPAGTLVIIKVPVTISLPQYS